MKSSKRLLLVIAAVILLTVSVPWLSRLGDAPSGYRVAGEWSYSEFQTHLEKNDVIQARFDPDDHTLYVLAVPKDSPPGTAKMKVAPVNPYIPLPAGLTWKVVLPSAVGVPSSDVLDDLKKHHVDFQVMTPPAPSSNSGAVLFTFLFPFLPTLLIIGFFWWMYRRQSLGGAPGQRMGNLRGPNQKGFKAVNPRDNKTRLADVAGCEEAKTEVAEFVKFLRDPEPYHRVNARMTRGVLMVGPPGTGKTMLARAIAGEAQVPFFAVSGSEFVEMFVGVGASRVRDLFQAAKQQGAAIVFIDEVDAIGRSRSNGMGQGNDEREQTLNQLLVEMDGFNEDQNIVVLAATNRADVLDKALLRAGRFDRQIAIPLPDRTARREILSVHAAKVPLANEVDLDLLARGTVGFSGADLSNLVNEAALLAGRHRQNLITRAHLDEALDKIMMGHARAGGIKNVRERKVVAYHEAGHAIVARMTPRTEPVHKITIIPRGMALGLTVQLAEEESFNHDSEMLEGTLKVLMGGRAAEQVALNTQTVGASNDFARASRLARKMMGSWGMNKELGTVVFQDDEVAAHVPSPWSNHWQKELDDRIVACVKRAYATAVDILETQKPLLEAVAQSLLTDETLDAEAFEALVQHHGTDVPERPRVEQVNLSKAAHPLDPI